MIRLRALLARASSALRSILSRARRTIACALTGHRWGVTARTRAGLYAPRLCCLRCGVDQEPRLTPGEVALGLIPIACVAIIAVLAVLTLGGVQW